jgi:hypothetical protein
MKRYNLVEQGQCYQTFYKTFLQFNWCFGIASYNKLINKDSILLTFIEIIYPLILKDTTLQNRASDKKTFCGLTYFFSIVRHIKLSNSAIVIKILLK